MSLRLDFAARTDVGLQRDGNEDSLYAGPRLLAVADGMGGAAGGEVASAVAIETLVALDREDGPTDVLGALTGAVEDAQVRLRRITEEDPSLEGMGTTLTALLRTERRLGLVHVGDSRGYLFRDGSLEQITHDHTLVQALVDEGRITAAEAEVHPRRSLLLRVLDGHGEVELDLSVRELRRGDRYLLCSDGLSGVVSDRTIRDTLATGTPREAVDRLVELALRAGAPDNVSAVVADVVEADGATAAPVLAGAVAPAVDDRDAAVPDTPATRAAELARSAPAEGAGEGAAPAGGARSRGRGRRRWAVGGLVVLLLVVAAVLGTWLWLRTQYYVGVAAGSIAIYRGVPASVAGLRLSTVASTVPSARVADLPQYERERLSAGIAASSLSSARQIVAALRSEEPSTTPPAAAPTATATPSAGPRSPRPTGSRRATPTRTSR